MRQGGDKVDRGGSVDLDGAGACVKRLAWLEREIAATLLRGDTWVYGVAVLLSRASSGRE